MWLKEAVAHVNTAIEQTVALINGGWSVRRDIRSSGRNCPVVTLMTGQLCVVLLGFGLPLNWDSPENDVLSPT